MCPCVQFISEFLRYSQVEYDMEDCEPKYSEYKKTEPLKFCAKVTKWTYILYNLLLMVKIKKTSHNVTSSRLSSVTALRDSDIGFGHLDSLTEMVLPLSRARHSLQDDDRNPGGDGGHDSGAGLPWTPS